MLSAQIAKLQGSDSDESELNWTEDFKVGSAVEGKIQEIKDVGVIVSFGKFNDVLGFVTHYQRKSLPLFLPLFDFLAVFVDAHIDFDPCHTLFSNFGSGW